MDIERLRERARIIQSIRNFFVEAGYLETDTPLLSESLIPETSLEVFKTELVTPSNASETGTVSKTLYLVPSPEVHLKKLLAEHGESVFQISKCFRNYESTGNLHSPEFTMLEYYTVDADYSASVHITEELFDVIGVPHRFKPPFLQISVDDAFSEYAHFALSKNASVGALAEKARAFGLAESAQHPFDSWEIDDLFELLLVHQIEPHLPSAEQSVILYDYPAFVPCLARDKKSPLEFKCKERWELYCAGIELANCYTEETDKKKVKAYFAAEGAKKAQNAIVKHAINDEYYKLFSSFPPCSGVALGVDRLVAVMLESKTIAAVIG
ncbi:MAG: tRNA synthetase, class II [Treponemataceae bacterium]|nr:MAG: tRNA synthetase, class II [Treponemataceae bacterium]